MYSGFMRESAWAVLTACSSDSSSEPRPAIAVTDSFMPACLTIRPARTISSAVSPLLTRRSTSSEPDSRPR